MMLVNELKEAKCKSSTELLSLCNILLSKNEYEKQDLEHCIDWLIKSMISMEKTFKRVKYERDLIQASTSNIKTAYEMNLENNQKLANEAKGLAYTIWRYEKKRKVVHKIIENVRNYAFPFYSKRGKEIKNLIAEMDEKFKNYDELTKKFKIKDLEAKVNDYMRKPVIGQANRIAAEDFEKLMKEGQAKTKLEIMENPINEGKTDDKV